MHSLGVTYLAFHLYNEYSRDMKGVGNYDHELLKLENIIMQ